MDPANKEDLKKLTDKNITMFSTRIKRALATADPNIRVDECRNYLKLWEEVVDKNYDFLKLSSEARSEVEEAAWSES